MKRKNRMKNYLTSLEELVATCDTLRTEGKRIVTTNGTFDLLHPGHVAILQEAKRFGDVLIVAINSDDSVKRLEGNNRPIFNQSERAAMLCALRWVDYVTVFSEDTPLAIIRTLRPDFHVKGGTFIRERIEEEKRTVERSSGELVQLGMVGEYSTTRVIEACKQTAQ